MALFIEGMQCTLCGKEILSKQGVIGFAPLIANSLDPLYIFHDGTFHTACFYRHPLAHQMQKRVDEWEQETKEWPPSCAICNSVINNPDEYFTFGHLTDDPTSPLHVYNYKQYHLSCLKGWQELSLVLAQLKELEDSHCWGGLVLQSLIVNIDKLMLSL